MVMEKIDVYRGESEKYDNPCTPSIFRIGLSGRKLMEFENHYYKDAYKYMSKLDFVKNKQKAIDDRDDYLSLKMMGFFQHYGIKTRMLDVTINQDIARYFCCNKSFDEDGYIYRIDNCGGISSESAASITRKLDCIKNINSVWNQNIIDYFSNDTKIQKTTITNCVSIDFRNTFKVLSENVRYEAQQGRLILFGFPIENDVLCDSNSRVNGVVCEKVISNNKIDNLIDLANNGICFVRLFPDSDKAIYAKSLYYTIKNMTNCDQRKDYLKQQLNGLFDENNISSIINKTEYFLDESKENRLYFILCELVDIKNHYKAKEKVCEVDSEKVYEAIDKILN